MTRSHQLGGTDAASLIGLGRLSPLALYLRLTGEVKDDFEGNDATEAGLLFEDHVAVPMVASRYGMRLVRPDERTMVLPDDPRIGVSLDFEVADNIGSFAEIKLTGSRAMWGQPGEKVPLHVAAQAQFQMAVARARGRAVPVVHVIAMFVPGFVMEDFEVEEDAKVGDGLLKAARQMMKRVDAKDPPKPGDEVDARMAFLARGGSHVATLEEVEIIAQLKILAKAEKDLDAQRKLLRDALLPRIGEATEIVHPTTGEVLATWRANRVFDEPKFLLDHPTIAKDYQRTTLAVSDLKKDHKRLAEAYMVTPTKVSDQVRPFKLKGE